MSRSKKTILITGSNGMLGSTLAQFFFNEFNIVLASRAILDITDPISVDKVFHDYKPDIVIHAAALTNVELCEKNPDLAYLTNTLGTQNLVNVCARYQPFFIFISSTGVYGNYKMTPYSEFDDAKPTTIYHQSKIEAEKIIANHLNVYSIIRTGWLYGGEVGHRKNFVYQRFLEAKGASQLFANKDQIGSPTFVGDLANQIRMIMDRHLLGIFNCVNQGSVSRYEYVRHIVSCFELDTQIVGVNKDHFERIADVPDNESAINYRLDLLNLNVMPSWQLSLEKYIYELKKSA